jgi:hypothetical protein
MVALVAMANFPVRASDAQMDNGALHKAIAGKIVHLATPLGALPINYRGDGTMWEAPELCRSIQVRIATKGAGGSQPIGSASGGTTGWAEDRIALSYARRGPSCIGREVMAFRGRPLLRAPSSRA